MLEEFRFVLQKLLCKPLCGLSRVEGELCACVQNTNRIYVKSNRVFRIKDLFLTPALYLSLILMLDLSFLLSLCLWLSLVNEEALWATKRQKTK